MTDSRNTALAATGVQNSSALNDVTEQVAVSIRKKYETNELQAAKQTGKTLLDFPGNWKNEPEWKRSVREKVRAVRDKHAGNEPPPVLPEKSAEAVVPAYSAPRLVIEITKEMTGENEKQNEILAKALKRIEDSRKKHGDDYQEMLRLEKRRIEEARQAELLKKEPIQVRDNVRAIPLERLQNRTSAEAGIHVSSSPNSVHNSFASNPLQTSANPNSIHNSFAPNSAKVDIVNNLRPSMPLSDEHFTLKTIAEIKPSGEGKIEEKPVVAEERELREIPLEVESIAPVDVKLTAQTLDDEPSALPKQIKLNGNDDVAYLDELIDEETGVAEDFAPIKLRALSGIIDAFAGLTATFLLFVPFGVAQIFSFGGFLLFLGVLAVIMFLYYSSGLHLFGTTLGKRIFSLYVIDAETGELPTLEQATKSTLTYLASFVALGVPLAIIFFTPEKRALHDLFSGTISIREIE